VCHPGEQVDVCRWCNPTPPAKANLCIIVLRLQPQPVPLPTQLLTGSLKGLRSDEELAAFVAGSKGGNTAVVEFGTTWCVKCHEMFPQFYQLTKKVRDSMTRGCSDQQQGGAPTAMHRGA
jgi:hypothetical protein